MIHWIELVGQASASAEAGHLVLYNPHQRWRLSVAFEEEADWRVCLRDLEVPHAKRRRSVSASTTARASTEGAWHLDG
jgi:hypothetical protein